MRVVVLGAAGQTGRLVVDGLVALGHDVRAVVRRDDQAEAAVARGAAAFVADVAQLGPSEMPELFHGADAAVWAAAAGYGADPELVDGDACIAAQQAADEAGVGRWVQISSMYADRPDLGPPFLQPVLRAKHRSDVAVTQTGLGWTVIRAGGMTNDIGTGQVHLGSLLDSGTVPRADVAAVALACLTTPSAACSAFDLVSGMTPVDVALAAHASE
ncbi:MAG: NAD(P)H-binding protein [Jiangellales bacterium]